MDLDFRTDIEERRKTGKITLVGQGYTILDENGEIVVAYEKEYVKKFLKWINERF